MAQKYVTHSSGRLIETEATTQSTGTAEGGSIVALEDNGKLHTSVMPVGVGPDTVSLETSEIISAGDFVNIFDDAGTTKVRKADAGTNKAADGFMLAATQSAETGLVYLGRFNNQLGDLTGGTKYYLSDTTPGAVTNTPPTNGTGKISQFLGRATNHTTLIVEINRPIELA